MPSLPSYPNLPGLGSNQPHLADGEAEALDREDTCAQLPD